MILTHSTTRCAETPSLGLGLGALNMIGYGTTTVVGATCSFVNKLTIQPILNAAASITSASLKNQNIAVGAGVTAATLALIAKYYGVDTMTRNAIFLTKDSLMPYQRMADFIDTEEDKKKLNYN